MINSDNICVVLTCNNGKSVFVRYGIDRPSCQLKLDFLTISPSPEKWGEILKGEHAHIAVSSIYRDLIGVDIDFSKIDWSNHVAQLGGKKNTKVYLHEVTPNEEAFILISQKIVLFDVDTLPQLNQHFLTDHLTQAACNILVDRVQ